MVSTGHRHYPNRTGDNTDVQGVQTMNLWKYWCNAIGTKAFDNNKNADRVALIRTFWVVLHIITCIAIISNTIRQW